MILFVSFFSTLLLLFFFLSPKTIVFKTRATPCFVGWSVGPSTPLLLFSFLGPWPHSSCPNALVTATTAPAHQHATVVVVYLVLFEQLLWF